LNFVFKLTTPTVETLSCFAVKTIHACTRVTDDRQMTSYDISGTLQLQRSANRSETIYHALKSWQDQLNLPSRLVKSSFLRHVVGLKTTVPVDYLGLFQRIQSFRRTELHNYNIQFQSAYYLLWLCKQEQNGLETTDGDTMGIADVLVRVRLKRQR